MDKNSFGQIFGQISKYPFFVNKYNGKQQPVAKKLAVPFYRFGQSGSGIFYGHVRRHLELSFIQDLS